MKRNYLAHSPRCRFSAKRGWGGAVDPSPAIPPNVDARVLGEPWRALVSELAGVPSADAPADRGDLDRHAMEVAKRLLVWLGHIGFAWDDTDEAMYFRVMKPDQWVL